MKNDSDKIENGNSMYLPGKRLCPMFHIYLKHIIAYNILSTFY